MKSQSELKKQLWELHRQKQTKEIKQQVAETFDDLKFSIENIPEEENEAEIGANKFNMRKKEGARKYSPEFIKQFFTLLP